MGPFYRLFGKKASAAGKGSVKNTAAIKRIE
jgi:hypothetical protein